MIGASGEAYREALARGRQRYRELGAPVVVDEFSRRAVPVTGTASSAACRAHARKR